MGLLGCHVSIRGGVQNAPQRGAELGCEAIQIFSRNQRQWASKPISLEHSEEFKKELKRYKIRAVMAHSIYLINLASPDPALRLKSEEAFLDEMDRCEQLGIPYLVFHPGSHKGTSLKKGIANVIESLRRLLHLRVKYKLILLIENTAGAGSIIGSCFDEIAEILDQVGMPGRLEVCFDTAHAFAAGYDLRTSTAYNKTLDQFHTLIGLHHLKAFHINDAFSELGSHHDRHADIGQGQIGLECFRCLVNDKRFRKHPMVLETPSGEEGFRQNLQQLFTLREKTQ